MKHVSLLLLISILGLSSSAQATSCNLRMQKKIQGTSVTPSGKSVSLNKKMKWQEYLEKIKSVQAGDVIRFDRNTSFLIQGVFGHGDTTMVFDIGNEKALRVPLVNEGNSVTLLNDFIYSNEALVGAGVPVVQVDHELSRIDQFAVVDVFHSKATLEDMIRQTKKWKSLNLSPDEEEAAQEKFYRFAKKLWSLKTLGDFRADQIGFDGEDWILMDYGRTNTFINDFDSKENPFTSYDLETDIGNAHVEVIRPEMYKRVNKDIQKARASAEKDDYSIRPRLGTIDSETEFLINFPYPEHLPEGMKITAHRQTSYTAYLTETDNDEVDLDLRERFPIQIGHALQDKGKYTLYQVQIEGKGQGLLAIKNDFKDSYGKNKIEFLKAKDMRDKFDQIKKSAVELARGIDYILFSTP